MVRKGFLFAGVLLLLIFGISIAAADESSYQTPLPEYNLSVVDAPVEFITHEDGSTAQLIVIQQDFAVSGNIYTAYDGTPVSEEVVIRSADLSPLHNEGNVKALIYWVRLFGAKNSIQFLDNLTDDELKTSIQGKISGANGEMRISSTEFSEPSAGMKLPMWKDGYSIAMGANDNGEPRPVVRISEPAEINEQTDNIVILSEIYSGLTYGELEFTFYTEMLGRSADQIIEKEDARKTIWNGSEDGGSWNTFSVTASLEEKQKADMELSEEILRGSSVMLN